MNGAASYTIEFVRSLSTPAGDGILCATATDKYKASKALAECGRVWRGAGKVWKQDVAQNTEQVHYQGTGTCTALRRNQREDGFDGYLLKERNSRVYAGYFRIIKTR